MTSREDAHQAVRTLVERFREKQSDYTRSGSIYNETQLRTDFLNPFLQALGWDVLNEKDAPQHLREVVHEDTVEIEDETGKLWKKPDYAMRAGLERKFFVEAKKPSVRIAEDDKPAFQLRRYGWSARMPVSVLTNFDKLAIYDCRPLPRRDDNVRVARLQLYSFEEYVTKFDEIYDQLSRDAVYSGQFDETFGVDKEQAGTEPFDQFFLQQIQTWRLRLADNLISRNPTLSEEEINFLVQRLINRIVFLRICEDRELEAYKALQKATTYDELKALFIQADKKYNSGLFDFIEDTLSLSVNLDDQVLIDIFRELYFPESPYAFSVVEANVLGEIYELFLGQRVSVRDGAVEIVDKPEVVASSGVVPTPVYIVRAIVQRALAPLCNGKSPDELASLRVADVCCGSGSFLLVAYEYLLDYHLEWYIQDGPEHHTEQVYEGQGNRWYLTLAEKQRIIRNNVYGVDIDIQAVEVTRFSLLLKVLEDESTSALAALLSRHTLRALPNLDANIRWGNSLVDSTYFAFDKDVLTDGSAEAQARLAAINVFNWQDRFPAVMDSGGFDAIIGNPPYVRIQNMVRYSPSEVKYYQNAASPYTTGRSNNFDKYALFIERSLSLLKPAGVLGYIVPNKFFKIMSGAALRKLIASGKYVSQIVDFGVNQVFGTERTTYTCILILRNEALEEFTVEHVVRPSQLVVWKYSNAGTQEPYRADELSEDPWVFLPPQAKALFTRLTDETPTTLDEVADIFVGVQTSADWCYIVRSIQEKETATHVVFNDASGAERSIEKAILRPSLYDVELQAFQRPVANTYIIFPYNVANGKAELYTPAEMQASFPLCWNYLTTYKARLVERNGVKGKKEEEWYRYGRSQSLTQFNDQPKLIWPVLSLEPRYVYDDQNIVFTGGGNGPYYALRPLDTTQLSIYYLMAILSHPAFEAMIRQRTSMFRGGYGSHGKQFILGLPIRQVDFSDASQKEQHDGIVKLVERLIAQTEARRSATTPARRDYTARLCTMLKGELDRRIEALYGIESADMQVITELQQMDKLSDS